MRHALLWMVLALVLGLSGCASPQAAGPRQLLVGHWEHSVEVMGERKTSQLVLSEDGRFVLTGRTETSLGTAEHVPERGTWSVIGGALEMKTQVQKPGATEASIRTELRRLVKVTPAEFVSADERFGIERVYLRRAVQ